MSRPVLGQKPTCGQRHATHRRILPLAEREYHDHRLHQPDFSDRLTMPPAMPARRLWAGLIRPRPTVSMLPQVVGIHETPVVIDHEHQTVATAAPGPPHVDKEENGNNIR